MQLHVPERSDRPLDPDVEPGAEVGQLELRYGNFELPIILFPSALDRLRAHRSAFLATHHMPCDMPHVVPVLVGC